MADNQKGAGFLNISSGISNIFGSLFGNNGAGDELAVILGKNGQFSYGDANYYAMQAAAEQQRKAQQQQLLLIVLGVGAVVALYFILKK